MDKKTFAAGVVLLQKRWPDNMFLPDFQRLGYSFIRAQLLSAQLDKMPELKDHKPDDQKNQTQGRAVNTLLIEDLIRTRRFLFTKRAKLSNDFHIKKTDKGRAEVSRKIQAIQKSISQKMIEIDTLRNGGPPPEQYRDKYPVPFSETEKLKLRLSLRSSISIKRRHIKTLEALSDEVHNKGRRLSRARAKLASLKTHLKYVEQSIK